MGKVQWTTDQQKVIDLRKRNILVSAAAGSGKTAVLVERIITMISDENNPIDIDRLLIVTFTNAAAAEMRERIGKAIEKKIEEHPGSGHLQKQMTLLHSAQITTIHSFCLYVIRNHFNVIDLEPGFRIGDEAELKLMRTDVMREVLEENYAKGEENFLAFVESYSTGKTDEGIEDIVLRLYDFSISYPWPEEWLTQQKEYFGVTDFEQMEQTNWMQRLMEYLFYVAKDFKNQNLRAQQLCNEPDGPYTYMDALLADADLIGELTKASTYEAYGKVLDEINWKRLSAKRDEAISDEKKELVKSIRDDIKKSISDIQKHFFYASCDDMLADMQNVEQVMEVLIDLTIEFANAYAKKKEEKNIVDFSDLEHFALNILVNKQEERPSMVAEDLSNYYEEILIDEYQDSNLVQETILRSISKERKGQPNIFMVGDVKQSIYKFRLARPELFMEKYERYSLEDSKEQRIDLHKNFRSRPEVLSGINYIFEQIMTKELGNIEYDEDAALYPGATFPKTEETISTETELILIKEEEFELEDEELVEYTQKEVEAKAIAKRIKELVNPEKGTWISGKDGYKKAEFKDIVILLRTMTGWSDLFAEVLMSEGIPSYSDTQTGYFSTIEVKTMLNMLRIIDNPRQDIPLASILRSPIVQLSDEELALVRVESKSNSLYEAVLEYSCLEEASQGKEKLINFLERFNQYRKMVVYTPIPTLLQHILEDTGYYQYVLVMPGGSRRSGNLDMLVQRAIDYEATSYRGLFHFIRYIEKLHKFDIDFGQASDSNDNENAVRIMSIHKSKGLEFPIVFVSGLGKVFNNQDARSKLVLHPDLGIGPDFIDYKLRIKSPTLLKKVIQKQIVLENLGEELRIQYVAMTRAKEKLILTGNVKNYDKQMARWMERSGQKEKKMSFHSLSKAGNYLDWIVPALVNHPAWQNLGQTYECEQVPPFKIRTISLADCMDTEVQEQLEKKRNKELLLDWNTDVVYDEAMRAELKKHLNYSYPYNEEAELKAKMTVTELKLLSQMVEEEDAVELLDSRETAQAHTQAEAYVPKFLRQEETISRMNLGTLYHKVLETIDLYIMDSEEDVLLQLDLLVENRQITEEDKLFVDKYKLLQFTKSELAGRMRNASNKGKLWKEQKFVYGLPAKQVYQDSTSEELILIQGIIDVYFEEDNGLILVDYKSDYVPRDTEQLLIERYRTQLDYYQAALEQMTGKKVKERIIYSLSLGKEIWV